MPLFTSYLEGVFSETQRHKNSRGCKPRPEWLMPLQNAHLVNFFPFGLPEQGQAFA